MIEISNITKTYNAGKANVFTALKGVSLSIGMNCITVFRGPSGSGKTTLLSIIGCMARPTSGRIFLEGRETTSLPERFAADIRRKVFGFIFQSYNLMRGITVLENVMLPAYPTGQKYVHIKARALNLLDQLKIVEKASSRVDHLSGGERQRTAIARALINDPKVIIADEPTAHLDTEMAESFLEIIYGLKAEGRSVVIASHDPLVYDSGQADRVVTLRDGQVVQNRGGPA